MNKKIIYIIVVLAVVLSIYLGVKDSFKTKSSETNVIDIIEKYNYKLYDNRQESYKEKYYELKENLKSEEINDIEYAKKVAELFAIDFFTLDNKLTNTDIGGLEFIYGEMVTELSKKARNTIYKNVESNIYGDRNQELPSVKSAETTKIETKKYEHDKLKDDNAYEISVDIKYEKDLKYENSVTLTLVHEQEKIYIVEIA